MAAKHAVLSASSSERWLNCPPSARLCEAYEDKGSDYAAEGTDAHALCEFRLKQALGIPADDGTPAPSIRFCAMKNISATPFCKKHIPPIF